jgi:hypothetical protein
VFYTIQQYITDRHGYNAPAVIIVTGNFFKVLSE